MRLSNNLLLVHLSGFEQAIVALRAAGGQGRGQGRLHDEIAALFAQNVQVAGDDVLAAAVRTAMQQIAAAVPDLPAQQASKYQNWLLTRYRQNWAAQTQTNPPQPLLLEDLYKYADDLTLYHNKPNVIKKRAGISTDLFAIDSPFELYQQLKALRGETATEFKPLSPSQQSFIDSNQAIVIGQTAQWRLVMPLTMAASQEFGSGTRWCTAAQKDNAFNDYFPEKTLLYLEASGMGKTAFVLQDGKITKLFNAEDTQQTASQQQALLDKLPTLAAFFSKLYTATSLLLPIIDKADFCTAFDLIMASRNLAPHVPINDTALAEKVNSANLREWVKNAYLIKTAKSGLIKTVEALLKHGADIHDKNDGALRMAAYNGRTDVLRLLLNSGADIHAKNDEALRFAAYYGHTNVVKLLLEHGANVHGQDNQALRWAAEHGNTDVVALLLEHGANVHANNNEALYRAAGRGRTDVVKLLLEHGANVHANNDEALNFAVRNGHAAVVELLLDHGANVHAQDNQALRWAAYDGHTDVVKLLLEHSADVHAYNDEALRSAADKGHADVVKLLLEHGADAHANNDAALFLAKQSGHTEVVKILKKHIAKKDAEAYGPLLQRPVAILGSIRNILRR